MKRVYGWRKDKKDTRDLLYRHRAKLGPVMAKTDLRNICPPVEDQGPIGSCTAQAIVGAMELLDIKARGKYDDLSRLMLYYLEREMENTIDQDSGAYIRDGIKVLASKGVCHEELWPYDVNRIYDKPDTNCFDNALDHNIEDYRRVIDVNEIPEALSQNLPVIFGIDIYKGFESEEAATTGRIPDPNCFQSSLGGHAMLIVGHDSTSPREDFLVRNSWGYAWGEKGYCYISKKNVKRHGSDFWVISKREI